MHNSKGGEGITVHIVICGGRMSGIYITHQYGLHRERHIWLLRQ